MKLSLEACKVHPDGVVVNLHGRCDCNAFEMIDLALLILYVLRSLLANRPCGSGDPEQRVAIVARDERRTHFAGKVPERCQLLAFGVRNVCVREARCAQTAHCNSAKPSSSATSLGRMTQQVGPWSSREPRTQAPQYHHGPHPSRRFRQYLQGRHLPLVHSACLGVVKLGQTQCP